MAVDVKDVPPFDLTLVPFLWTENPDRSFVAEIDGLRADDELFRLTRDLLPVGEFELSVRGRLDDVLGPGTRQQHPVAGRHGRGPCDGWSAGTLHGRVDRRRRRAHVPGYTSVSILEGPIIAHELGHNMSCCTTTAVVSSWTFSIPITRTMTVPSMPGAMIFSAGNWSTPVCPIS